MIERILSEIHNKNNEEKRLFLYFAGEEAREFAIRQALRNSALSTHYIAEVFGISEELVLKILEEL